MLAATRIATSLEKRRPLPGDASGSDHKGRKTMLACGIASSLLYAAMIWGIRYEGYSLISQVPSELTAIGAPTQRLWARLGPIYTLLVAAFGWGIWGSAGRNRTVRIVGGLILAYASLGLLWPFAPMHQRDVLAAGGGTLSDTMHVALGGVTVFLMFLAIGFGAAAFGRRFRVYSIASDRRAPRVRRVDVPRGSPLGGESADTVDRVVGAHQHQRVPALGRGAGDHAVADRLSASRDRRRRYVMNASLVAALAAGVAIPASGVYLRYRRDLKAARERLAAVNRHVISTPWGAVEYAERGSGAPVLVVHGIFHNCVGGLLSVRDLFLDRRIIAPSRFGYLGSSMPPSATPAAQADAFAALLDALGIDRIDVIGESAGATSALQLALRHPEKVKHLAVLVGNLPGSPTAIVQPSWAKRFNRQLPLWVLRTFAPSTMVRLVAGLPKGFAMSREDARFVDEFIDSLFPVSSEGVDFDAFISNADVNDYNLEAINVPTLIVHTKDDQVASHEASQRAAERIPGARFVSLESGGHLMIGQTRIIRDEVADFFAEQRDRRAERVAS